MTTQDQINAYLETLNRKKKTIRTYRNALTQFVNCVGPDAPLTLETARTFLKTLKGYAPSTQHVYITPLKALYRFYNAAPDSELDKIIEHYCSPIETAVVNFNREGIEKLISYAETLTQDLTALRDRAAILTYVDTGLRLEELTSLKVGDIDFLEMRTFVRGKNKDKDVVRLSTRATQALRDYIAARAAVEPNTRKPLQSQPLLCRHDPAGAKKIVGLSGGSGLRASIKDRMQETGIDPATIRIHDFRHYLITTIYIGTNGNGKLTQSISRHKSAQMMNRYVHFADSAVDQAYHQIINEQKEYTP